MSSRPSPSTSPTPATDQPACSPDELPTSRPLASLRSITVSSPQSPGLPSQSLSMPSPQISSIPGFAAGSASSQSTKPAQPSMSRSSTPGIQASGPVEPEQAARVRENSAAVPRWSRMTLGIGPPGPDLR